MHDQRGNVFVESIVAVAILIVAIVPAFSMFTLSPSIQDDARRQSVAMNIARSHLEFYHTISQAQWDALSTNGGDAGIYPTGYTFPAGYTATATSRLPDAGLHLKYVTVNVQWQNNRGHTNTVSMHSAVARRE